MKLLKEFYASSKKQLHQSVLKFLQENNRPYSLNDIHDKCTKSDGKSDVQKALDYLVSREKIVEKQFGKQKIYFPKQDEDEEESKNEISVLEKKLSSLQESLKEKENRIKKYEIEMKQLSTKPSKLDLEIRQDELKIKVISLMEEAQLILASPRSSQETKQDLEKINARYEKVLSEFRKRKRICNDLIESIMEGYPNTKKHLLEDVGIETDEMANFTIKL